MKILDRDIFSKAPPIIEVEKPEIEETKLDPEVESPQEPWWHNFLISPTTMEKGLADK